MKKIWLITSPTSSIVRRRKMLQHTLEMVS
jgi:hypothetical protein